GRIHDGAHDRCARSISNREKREHGTSRESSQRRWTARRVSVMSPMRRTIRFIGTFTANAEVAAFGKSPQRVEPGEWGV
ncbi:MAG: hypothetical protein WCJ18_07745, partial [Planctomycetota bacterium]